MLVNFWGVCGSLPSPTPPKRVKEKIAAILEYTLPEDLANDESRKRFLDGLPPWLYGTVGGNTPCVSVSIEGFNEPIIFDAGSGLRELGNLYSGMNPKPQKYHVFFSHFHWDHLHGLPFFSPAYDPHVAIDFYSPKTGLEEVLSGQMQQPYFPVPLKVMSSKKSFIKLSETFAIGPAAITCRKLNHPGDSFSYQVSHNGKRFIYATDTELSHADFIPTEENNAYFKNADLIVLDAQYTLGEAIEKYNWGHSAFSLSVDFAASWGIKHLVLFHHDPAYDGFKLHGILQSARWYLEKMDIKGLEISLATEGLEIRI
jgi:phosphoribosyl 1,2-cyclic phosphodiesterase